MPLEFVLKIGVKILDPKWAFREQNVDPKSTKFSEQPTERRQAAVHNGVGAFSWLRRSGRAVARPASSDTSPLDHHRHERHQQRVRAARHPKAVLRPDVLRELLLKFDDLGPHDVLAVLQHGVNTLIDRGLEALVLGLEVDEVHVSSLRGHARRCRRRSKACLTSTGASTLESASAPLSSDANCLPSSTPH